MTELGGKPNVVSAVPEIVHFEIKANHDFIILASDGIFDTVSNKEAVMSICLTKIKGQYRSIHELCGKSILNLMRLSLIKQTADNITVVIIAFDNFCKR